MNKQNIFSQFIATVVIVILVLAIVTLITSRQAKALDATELLSYFVDQLTPYGQWESRDNYGRVWVPNNLEKNWTPYSHGHWIYSDEYGWIWKPQEQWGEIPYHYGRWSFENSRWFWVPDDTWGPAWVDWRQNDEYVGWAPLPPEADWGWQNEWRPSYSTHSDGYDRYTFIPQRYFTSNNVHSYIVPSTRAPQVFEQTRNVTVYKTVNERVFNEGPGRDFVARATGHKVEAIRYQPRSIQGRALPAPAQRHVRTQDNQAVATIITEQNIQKSKTYRTIDGAHVRAESKKPEVSRQYVNKPEVNKHQQRIEDQGQQHSQQTYQRQKVKEHAPVANQQVRDNDAHARFAPHAAAQQSKQNRTHVGNQPRQQSATQHNNATTSAQVEGEKTNGGDKKQLQNTKQTSGGSPKKHGEAHASNPSNDRGKDPR